MILNFLHMLFLSLFVYLFLVTFLELMIAGKNWIQNFFYNYIDNIVSGKLQTACENLLLEEEREKILNPQEK